MSIGREEVERIAALARLRLGEAEVERLTGDLNDILDHVEALRALEEAGEPSGPESPAAASTRASEEGGPDPLHLSPPNFAPRWSEGFFVVPPPPGVQAGEGDA